MMKNTGIGVALIALAILAAGCTNSADTSGFKAEAVPSKVDLTNQIAQVKANPKIPAGIKAMALKKLEKQQAAAN